MKCTNKKCPYFKNEQCNNKSVVTLGFNCEERINPSHTPNYAEEQLEYAQDKENRCYNEKCVANNNNGECENELMEILGCNDRDTKQPTPINYEEEYNKLKKENSNYSAKITILKRLHENQRLNIKSEMEENKNLKNEIKTLQQLNDGFRLAVNEKSDLKEKNKEWESEYTELKEYNQLLEKRHKEDEERLEMQKTTIIDLKQTIQSKNNIIEITKNKAQEWLNKYEELKKQNNQGYMEQMNKILNEKNEEIERLNDYIVFKDECFYEQTGIVKKLENEKVSLLLEIARYKNKDKVMEIMKKLIELL